MKMQKETVAADCTGKRVLTKDNAMPPSGAAAHTSAEGGQMEIGDKEASRAQVPGSFPRSARMLLRRKASKTRRHTTSGDRAGEGQQKRRVCDVPIKIAPDYSEIRCRNEERGEDAGSGLNQQSWQVRGEGGKGKRRGGVCLLRRLWQTREEPGQAAGTPTNGIDGSLSEPKRKSGPGVQPS
jgi:hypothetical protein